MFNMPGGWEWMVILLVALLIFGKRLPEVARSIGKAFSEFRRSMEDIKSEVETAVYKSEREYDEQKKLNAPPADRPATDVVAPDDGDDTHRFGDPYAPDGAEQAAPDADQPPAQEKAKDEEAKPAESSPPPEPAASPPPADAPATEGKS